MCGHLVLCIFLLLFKLIQGQDAMVKVDSDSVVVRNFAGRIVNGTIAALKQFPAQVSLRRLYSDNHFCGGSIIAPKWVLTASHCMFDLQRRIIPEWLVRVVGGEVYLESYWTAHAKSEVSQIIVHEDFDYNTLWNDVALLKLKSPFKLNSYVQAVPIARKPTEPYVNCQVSGWGYPKFNQRQVSEYLKFVDVPLLPIPLCRELLQKYSRVPVGMICAGYYQGGKDACQGDSGGGLLCNGYLTGVVSGGEGCGFPKLPGLYADVQHYADWIDKHVNSSENTRGAPKHSLASSTSTNVLSTVGLFLSLLALASNMS